MEMKTVHIGDLGEIKTGSTPSKKNPDNYGDYALWIKPTDINPDEKYTRVVEEMFSEKAAIDCRSRLIPANSICVPCIGTVGTKLTMTPCDCFVNQSINAVIPNEDYDNDYVYYLLLNFLPNLKSINKGTASGREYIAKSAFENIEIKVHSDIKVQRTIGKIFSAYDDMIDNCKKQIALLEEAAQRLYRKWFVDLHFPGHETTHIGENDLPIGWQIKSISSVCKYIASGSTPSRKQVNYWENTSISWFKTKELLDGWLFDSEEHISDEAKNRTSVKLFPANSILMAIYASPTLGRLGILSNEATFNQAALGFIVNDDEISMEFLFLKLRELRDEFNQVARGAGQQNISGEIVKQWQIVVPAKTVIDSFTDIVKPYFTQWHNASSILMFLKKSKEILLPRLISGQIHINA